MKHSIHLRNNGMFHTVNVFINLSHRAERENIEIVPKWYYSPYAEFGVDAWPLFFDAKNDEDAVYFEHRQYLHDNIIAPKLFNGSKSPLMPPKSRLTGNIAIKKYFAPKESVINGCFDLPSGTIGLHIRGPKRTKGVEKFLQYLNQPNPPFDLYFEKVDDLLESHQHILICTDAASVRETVQKRYGNKVIHLNSQLPNTTWQSDDYSTKEKYNWGRNILIEAIMLSKTDSFVHGNSNLSNFVLCSNPELPSQDIYQSLYKKINIK